MEQIEQESEEWKEMCAKSDKMIEMTRERIRRKMPDRELDHRKESVGLKTAIRQIEERMQKILQAAEDKTTETIRRWHDEQATKAGGKSVGCIELDT